MVHLKICLAFIVICGTNGKTTSLRNVEQTEADVRSNRTAVTEEACLYDCESIMAVEERFLCEESCLNDEPVALSPEEQSQLELYEVCALIVFLGILVAGFAALMIKTRCFQNCDTNTSQTAGDVEMTELGETAMNSEDSTFGGQTQPREKIEVSTINLTPETAPLDPEMPGTSGICVVEVHAEEHDVTDKLVADTVNC